MTETRAKLERDLDQILAEIRSQFKGERALDSGLLGEALDLVTQQAVLETPRAVRQSDSSPTQPSTSTSYLPPIIPSSRLFIETSAAASQLHSPLSPHLRSPVTQLPTPEESASDNVYNLPAISIFKHENRRIYANSEGLIDHLLETGVSLRAQIELIFSH
jgi:hypothetical protein